MVRCVEQILNRLHIAGGALQALHAGGEISADDLVLDLRDESAGNKIHEVEPFWIREKGVPQPDGGSHIEILAEEHHVPPQRVKVVVDLVRLDARSRQRLDDPQRV